MGAVFRVVLANLLGDEGIGLYQYAYPIYSTLLVISTAGIPVALSKIMAEKIALHDFREAMRVFKIAFIILSLSGLVISLCMFLGAGKIAVYLVQDPKAFYPVLTISPAIFFVTVMASLRGFFQGQQDMAPTAASQLLEQLIRVAFSIVLVIILLPAGLEYASAGATSGAAAGGLAGLLLLAVLYWRKARDFIAKGNQQMTSNASSITKIVGRIFSLAIPITIGGLVIPLLTLIDLAIVPRQLQAAGFDIDGARALYGQLTGMASSVVYFPNVIAIALSMSLVPAISEAYALGENHLIKARTTMAVKLTILFSLPSAVGLYLLSEPITILLFNNAEAGYSLAFMSWSVIPLCLYVTTTGIIQGLGRPVTPALNMFYGGAVKIVIAWYLTAIPALNVGGAALASVVGVAVAAFLNLLWLTKNTGWRFNGRALAVKPLVVSAVMGLAVYISYSGIMYWLGDGSSYRLHNGVATLVSITIGAVTFMIFSLFSGIISREEAVLIPLIGKKFSVKTKK